MLDFATEVATLGVVALFVVDDLLVTAAALLLVVEVEVFADVVDAVLDSFGSVVEHVVAVVVVVLAVVAVFVVVGVLAVV